MNLAHLTIDLPKKLRQEFLAACRQNDTTATAMVTRWVEWWLERNKVYQAQQGTGSNNDTNPKKEGIT